MERELAVRTILGVGAAIAATVLLAVAAVFLLLHRWELRANSDPGRLRVPAPMASAPLESAPQLDLQAYRREKQALAESTAWVDRQQGIARIPVAQAMALLAASAARAQGSGR